MNKELQRVNILLSKPTVKYLKKKALRYNITMTEIIKKGIVLWAEKVDNKG